MPLIKKDNACDKISIVIPVFNEAAALPRTLGALAALDTGLSPGGREIVVVDGGSSDGTVEAARRFTDCVILAQKGRGTQLKAGAEASSGGILFFIHADCIPPSGVFDAVRDTLSTDGVCAGAFDIEIDSPGRRYRIIERMANLRSRLTRVPYGDQGLFMLRATYEGIGGYSEIPIMEDIEIAGRLKKMGRIVFLSPPMKVSPRRWEREGMFYTTLRDWGIAVLFSVFGVAPEKLAGRYRDVR
jgi:rSAM/selenodomain-associated transferase 2